MLLSVAVLGVGIVGCGDDDNGKPQAEDIPSGAVAVIGEREVSKAALDRQTAMMSREQRRSSGRAPTAAERKLVASQALSMLLQREAIEQEAAERGIEVSRAEVRRTWVATARRQFKTKRMLRRFLHGQTVADILVQLRLQALSERVHRQVSQDAGGGKEGKKAVKEFQKDFQKRWQDKTTCSGSYTALGCSDDGSKK